MSSRVVFIILIALHLTTCALGLLLPVYSDEITYRMMYARMRLDSGALQYLFPCCPSTFLMSPPKLFYPLYLFDAWLFEDLSNLFSIRKFGWILSSLWLAGIISATYIYRRDYSPDGNRYLFPAFILSAASIGVMPLLGTLYRPELTMLIIISIVSLLITTPFLHARVPSSITVPIVLVLSWICLSCHPKAVILQPIFLASIFLVTRSWASRIISSLIILIMSFYAANFYLQRNTCIESQALFSSMNEQMLTPQQLSTDLSGTAVELLRQPLKVFSLTEEFLFSPSFNFGFIPTGLKPFPINILHLSANFCSTFIGLLLVVLSLYTLKPRRDRNLLNAGSWYLDILSIGFFVSFLGLILIEKTLLFYEAKFLLHLLVVWIVAASRDVNFKFILVQSFYRPLLGLVVMCSVLNSYGVIDLVRFSLPAWREPKNNSFEYLSVPGFNYHKIGEKVEQVAKRCGLWPPEDYSNLVIDDWTYPIFSRSAFPQHSLYVRFWCGFNSIDDYVQTNQYPGYIVRCNSLEHADLQTVSISDGDICCRRFPQ